MPTKFDFVSPGIQLREIDQSVLEPVPEEDGILLIGRARSGPAMRPVKVTNLNDFVEIFGTPMDGVRQSDPWRQGNTGAPNYAAYAAQAYLAAGVGPVKYLRLLGKQTSGTNNEAGWSMGSNVSSSISENAAAYGLIMMPSSSAVGVTAASKTGVINLVGGDNGHICTITIPAGAGGTQSPVEIKVNSTDNTGAASLGAKMIQIGTLAIGAALDSSDATTIAPDVVNAINSGTTANRVSAGSDLSAGIPGLTATHDGAGTITITATTLGTAANDVTFVNSGGGSIAAAAALEGGANQIYPAHLAAVFYCSGSAIGLNGEAADDLSALTKRAGSLIKSNNPNWGFDIYVSAAATQTVTHSVNFDPSSPNFIRNVMNTDPTMFYGTSNYADTVTENIPYFLGETFETNVSFMSAGATAGEAYAAIVSLSGALGQADDHRQQLTAARTGWFVSPQPSQKKLFYLTALSEGTEIQNNYYVTISDIKLATSLSPRASFTLSILKRSGARDQVVESYAGVTLDKNDDNYIVKRIGDINETWDPTSKKFSITGTYPNKSSYVRITMHPTETINLSDVPFGFVGPKVPATVAEINSDTVVSSSGWIGGNNTIPLALAPAEAKLIENIPSNFSMSVAWPTLQLTTKDTKMSSNYSSTDLFGVRQMRKSKNSHCADFSDLVHRRVMQDPHLAASDALSTASFVFTLDDIMSGSTVTNKYYFKEGSYSGGSHATRSISKNVGLTGTSGLIDGLRIRQFSAPLFGGADGVDIRFADPFSNERIYQGGSGANRYPEFTLNTAIDMIEDRDNIRYELVSMPGIVDTTLNRKLMDMSADRGDNLAIVDLSGIYRPGYDRENTNLAASINTITDYLDTQQIDNSYAASYYPNVRIRDTLNGNDTVLIVPPSVAAVGAIAKSEADSQPWFAPAGFNRGGLNRLGGPQGPICVGTVEHLTKADRDVLYAAHINPIARFPATGDTVIFGQRTLQQAASALDRINVRRLMIYLKKHIGNIADTILFDQNVEATWNRFKARADAVLSEVKTELGITEYKLVLDKSTTTPDLIDRNIMYAKIFIKPARAIEFIAIDFIITKTGVEFE
jgi:hypothetical protein